MNVRPTDMRGAACSSVRPVSPERFPIWPITAPPRMAKTPKRVSNVAMTSRITPAPMTAPDAPLAAAGAAGGMGFHPGEGSQEVVGSPVMPKAYARCRGGTSGEAKLQAFSTTHNVGAVASLKVSHQVVQLVVAVAWIMVKVDQAIHRRLAREGPRVLQRAVPPPGSAGVLRLGVLRIVD